MSLIEKIKGLSKGKKIGLGIATVLIIGAVAGQGEDKTVEAEKVDKPAVEATKEDKNTEIQKEKEENKVIYDKEGVKISFKGIGSDIMGAEIKLNIENNGKDKKTVQVRDLSINGYMIDGILSSTVEAGKKANDKITVLKSYLEENNIEKIEEIELKFAILSGNFMNTKNTETIKIKL